MDQKNNKESGKVSMSKFFDCEMCGKKLHEHEFKLCEVCEYERRVEQSFEEEDELEEAYDDYDNDDYDYEPGPCDDCDDRTFPVAARSCDTCPNGSGYMKDKVKACSCNRELTDDEQYQHDMWGCPNNA